MALGAKMVWRGIAVTADIRKFGFKRAARFVLPICVLSICLAMLAQYLSPTMWRDLPAHLSSVPFNAWLGAAMLTAISFYSLGRYDCVAHRHLHTGVPERQAQTSGIVAIAVAQTIGFGVFSGAFARWRLLPSMSLPRALIVSGFVSVSFVLGWAVVTAVACLALPAPAWVKLPAALIMAGVPLAAYALFRWPNLHVRQLRLRLPSLHAGASIIFWTFLDTAAAAGALWLLLPEGAGISYAAFLPVFLMAMGMALISNTPGGVGPFELMLLGLLPTLPADVLVQSIIAFRLIYYAVPACLGVLMLLRAMPALPAAKAQPVPLAEAFSAPRSEIGVIAQNGGYLTRTADGIAALWPTGQTVTALFAPVSGSVHACLDTLKTQARDTGRWPLMYKCDARAALMARQNGWSVVHLADDALVNPAHFTPDTPSRRGLRRKLRAAKKAGLELSVPTNAPWQELARIDAEWCKNHGPARGGTMGRYSKEYAENQWLAVASCRGKPVAFVTFFAARGEWALDLMRQTADAPDGTMHALVTLAIEAARNQGIASVSLAATPACPNPASPFWRAVSMRVVAQAGGPGLRQFKSTFAPQWVPRYAAAPGPIRLALSLADIAREVQAPPNLAASSNNAPHDLDENYELDLIKRA